MVSGTLTLAWGPCVVTIGVFDGVHRGHARLTARTVEVARALQLPALLLTFHPHPARVAGPPRNTAALSTPQRRTELARQLGVDAVLVLPFTNTPANTPAHEFTHIRTCLAAGDVTAAAEALGRPHQVAGRLAGNVLQVPKGTALPADGQYHGKVAINGAPPHPV